MRKHLLGFLTRDEPGSAPKGEQERGGREGSCIFLGAEGRQVPRASSFSSGNSSFLALQPELYKMKRCGASKFGESSQAR